MIKYVVRNECGKYLRMIKQDVSGNTLCLWTTNRNFAIALDNLGAIEAFADIANGAAEEKN